MVRRYDEPVEVRLAPGEAPDAGDRPHSFLWRGRLYLVREVVDHWQERRAWWRDDGDGTGGLATLPRERTVWRVVAAAGRAAGVGTYDLGDDHLASDRLDHLVADGDVARRWVLVRVAD